MSQNRIGVIDSAVVSFKSSIYFSEIFYNITSSKLIQAIPRSVQP